MDSNAKSSILEGVFQIGYMILWYVELVLVELYSIFNKYKQFQHAFLA